MLKVTNFNFISYGYANIKLYRNICKKIDLKQFLDNECSNNRNVEY